MRLHWHRLAALLAVGVLLATSMPCAAEASSAGISPALEKKWLQYRADVAQWQSRNFTGMLDIRQSAYQQFTVLTAELNAVSPGKLSVSTLNLPDLTTPRTSIAGLAAAVVAATDEKQSLAALRQLQAYIKDYNAGSKDRSAGITQQAQNIQTSIRAYMKRLADEANQQLQAKSRDTLAAKKAEWTAAKLTQEQVRQQTDALLAKLNQENKTAFETLMKPDGDLMAGKMNKLGAILDDLNSKMRGLNDSIQSGAMQFVQRQIALILEGADANIASAKDGWAQFTPDQRAKLGIDGIESDLTAARAKLGKDLEVAATAGDDAAAARQPPTAPTRPTGPPPPPQPPQSQPSTPSQQQGSSPRGSPTGAPPQPPQPQPSPPAGPQGTGPNNYGVKQAAIQKAVQAFTASWQAIRAKANSSGGQSK